MLTVPACAILFGFAASALTGEAWAADAYPVTYTSCGVTHTVTKSPRASITMNQGATEFMLALGLHDRMVGTAYLDDEIWPEFAAAYATIPVLSAGYPNETTIMAANPEFIYGSYFSAFAEKPRRHTNKGGIFSNVTFGVTDDPLRPCNGTGSCFPNRDYCTCRPQLHAIGTATYLEPTSCEDTSLRPTTATDETVYAVIRDFGRIFDVRNKAEEVIFEMKEDFTAARGMVASASLPGKIGFEGKLRAIWIDCVGRCCKNDKKAPGGFYLGAGTGAPNLIMQEAGMENLFADREGSWACVSAADILAKKPDVVVVVHASWDTALEKIETLYNHSEFCKTDFVQQAKFVTIPFSASTLSPRNGKAALDLAAAGIHVNNGEISRRRGYVNFESGVKFLDPDMLTDQTANLLCPLDRSGRTHAHECTCMYRHAHKVTEMSGTPISRFTTCVHAHVKEHKQTCMHLNRAAVLYKPSANALKYPVTYTSCGVTHTVTKSPRASITMNQGATEFMLALGLHDRMVGTAYLDDEIWPEFAAAYATIPVLSAGYPNETTIMAANPEFIYGSYFSAFAEKPRRHTNKGGIFSNVTFGVTDDPLRPCNGTGSCFPNRDYCTCRPQLHAIGTATYLEPTSCEDTSLRPTTATDETVYAVIRDFGRIFDVRNKAEEVIFEMKEDFTAARGMVASASLPGKIGFEGKLRAIWIDCVGRCCKNDKKAPGGFYLGAGTGAPNLIMQEAGMENLFADREGSWACVSAADILAKKPDVVVVVHASWDTALEKIETLYNHSEFCKTDFVQQAKFVTIPFSASTLSPRNGKAALDLAAAGIHVNNGEISRRRGYVNFESGVKFLDPDMLTEQTANLLCPLDRSGRTHAHTYMHAQVHYRNACRVHVFGQGVGAV